MLPMRELNVQALTPIRRFYRLAAATCLILMWGCTAVGPTLPMSEQQTQQRADELAQSGDVGAALELYADLAAASSGEARGDYLIAGTRLLIDSGDTSNARRWLARAREDANVQQRDAILILSADAELEDDRPEDALDRLGRLTQPPDPVSLVAAAAVEGRALFRLARVEEAITALVERELWLNDSAAVLANHELIWNGQRPIRASAHPARLA